MNTDPLAVITASPPWAYSCLGSNDKYWTEFNKLLFAEEHSGRQAETRVGCMRRLLVEVATLIDFRGSFIHLKRPLWPWQRALWLWWLERVITVKSASGLLEAQTKPMASPSQLAVVDRRNSENSPLYASESRRVSLWDLLPFPIYGQVEFPPPPPLWWLQECQEGNCPLPTASRWAWAAQFLWSSSKTEP